MYQDKADLVLEEKVYQLSLHPVLYKNLVIISGLLSIKVWIQTFHI